MKKQKSQKAKNLENIDYPSEAEVFRIFGRYLIGDKDSSKSNERAEKFGIEDLLHRMPVRHLQMGNPRIFRPGTSSPNPAFLDLVVYEDRSILLSKKWGDSECTHYWLYFYDKLKEEVFFTTAYDLFSS